MSLQATDSLKQQVYRTKIRNQSIKVYVEGLLLRSELVLSPTAIDL